MASRSQSKSDTYYRTMSQSASSQSSSTDTETTEQSGPQPAVRAAPSELLAAKFEYKERDEERAPNFRALPSGARANRVLIAGTITMAEDIGNENEYWRGEVNALGETLYVYIGQYADAGKSLLREVAESGMPKFIVASCKLDHYGQGDYEDDEQVPISDRRVTLQAEWVTEVDEQRRTQVLFENAVATIERFQDESVQQFDESIYQVYKGDEYYANTDFVANAVAALERLEGEMLDNEEEAEAEAEAEAADEPVPQDGNGEQTEAEAMAVAGASG